MELKEVIFDLCRAHGVSGNEEPALRLAKKYLEPFAEVSTDSNGNLYAMLGNPNANKTILLDAHIDRIGVIVTDINENGFVKVDKCGGMDIRVLQDCVLANTDGLKGTVCCLPPHLSDGKEDKANPISKTWVDFGMPRNEVEKHIKIGDVLTFCAEPAELLDGKITAPALDNRCGAAALIRVAELLQNKEVHYKIVILLSSQEETYGTGAATGAFKIDADEAIAVDVSFAAQPDISGQYSKISLGKGGMIAVSSVLDKAMSSKLISLAKEKNIPYQLEPIAGRTGTNADKIAVTKGGIRTAVVSIPQKYMHTQIEVINPADVEHTARLIAEYILCGGAFDD